MKEVKGYVCSSEEAETQAICEKKTTLILGTIALLALTILILIEPENSKKKCIKN